jgi:hypothetical protein
MTKTIPNKDLNSLFMTHPAWLNLSYNNSHSSPGHVHWTAITKKGTDLFSKENRSVPIFVEIRRVLGIRFHCAFELCKGVGTWCIFDFDAKLPTYLGC